MKEEHFDRLCAAHFDGSAPFGRAQGESSPGTGLCAVRFGKPGAARFGTGGALGACLASLLSSAPGASPAGSGAYEGFAYLPGDTAPAYVESYAVRLDGLRPLHARTEYRDREGRAFAERTLDFSRDPWRPGYHFRDLRTGYEERAEWRDGELRASVRSAGGAAPREKILRVPDPFVIDGGFTRFLVDHWDSLAAGARLRVHFVAVSRLDWFALEAWIEDSVRVVARPRNPALRLLVEPIRFAYDPVSRRLAEYEGTGNIRNADGGTPRVRIAYSPMRPAP